MSLKPHFSTPKWATLCSLTLGLALTACGTPKPDTSSSSSEPASSSSSSSSSTPASSSSVVSSSSSSSIPRPTGPSIDDVNGWNENAAGQSPAFPNQTDVPAVTSSFTVRTEVITAGLNSPWGIDFLPGDRLIVTEKPGTMRIVDANGTVSGPISGVPSVFYMGSNHQAGLLDVAVSPLFAEDRTIYMSYVETRNGGQATTVAKATLSQDDSRLENLEVLFRQTPSWANSGVGTFDILIHGHFGSRIAFDFNGNLFITVGERFNEEIRVNAQTLDNFIGKVVHITPSGEPAPDNPMINQNGVLPEIWSYGHRNVQAVDVHPLTGEVWTVEHGPQGGDEVNKPEGGKNYGWPVITYGRNYDYWGGAGNPIGDNATQKAGMEQPIYYWDPVIAPSSAVFYDGNMFPEWQNNLLIGGLVTNDVTRLMFDGDEVIGEERLVENSGRVRDINVADDGAIWICTDAGSLIRIYR